jgi:hypothetical protein
LMNNSSTSMLEQRADFGIITALRDEMIAVFANFGEVEEIQLKDIRYYHRARIRCSDGSEKIVVCVLATEMGQQPALNATRDLIAA